MNRPGSVLILGLCALGATLASASTRSAGAGGLRNLDLRQSADAQLLYARLQQAAARVCPAAPPYELARYAAYQRCMNAALTLAVQALETQPSSAPRPAASQHLSAAAGLVTPCARPTRL